MSLSWSFQSTVSLVNISIGRNGRVTYVFFVKPFVASEVMIASQFKHLQAVPSSVGLGLFPIFNLYFFTLAIIKADSETLE